MKIRSQVAIAIKRATKFYVLGLALLLLVYALAIPPTWFWSFTILVVCFVLPSKEVYFKMGTKD